MVFFFFSAIHQLIDSRSCAGFLCKFVIKCGGGGSGGQCCSSSLSVSLHLNEVHFWVEVSKYWEERAAYPLDIDFGI